MLIFFVKSKENLPHRHQDVVTTVFWVKVCGAADSPSCSQGDGGPDRPPSLLNALQHCSQQHTLTHSQTHTHTLSNQICCVFSHPPTLPFAISHRHITLVWKPAYAHRFLFSWGVFIMKIYRSALFCVLCCFFVLITNVLRTCTVITLNHQHQADVGPLLHNRHQDSLLLQWIWRCSVTLLLHHCNWMKYCTFLLHYKVLVIIHLTE